MSRTLAMLAITTFASAAFAQQAEPPRDGDTEAAKQRRSVRILWVGASYVPSETTSLVAKMLSTRETGMTVVDSRKPFGGAKQVVKNPAPIRDGQFDFVVLNDRSLTIGNAERIAETREAMGKAIRIVRDAKAVPILYCTWLRATPKQGTFDALSMEKDFDDFASHYEGLAKQHDVCLAPIGHAWQSAWLQRKEDTLRLYSRDENHASRWGLYLNACVMYSVVTGKSPVGDDSFKKKTADDPEIALFLQERH